MPVVQANGIDIYYEVQGEGEPLVLIPYLAADQACYAFQVAEYAKHYTCYHGRPARRGPVQQAGRAPTPPSCSPTTSPRSCRRPGSARRTSPGCRWARRPACGWRPSTREQVKTLSLHSAWTATDPFLRAVVEGWQIMAKGARQRHRDGHQGHLPLVLHPGAVRRQAGVHRLAGRVRPRPPDAAGGRVPAPVRGGARRTTPRRVLGSIQAPDADHLRAARPGVLDPVRRTAHRGDRGLRARSCSRTARTRRSTRTSRRSTTRTLAFLQHH